MPVYCPKCWWGDGWDAKKYAREFDFDKSFFAQFKELLNEVPALAILNDDGIGSSNCLYTNYFALGRNCYAIWSLIPGRLKIVCIRIVWWGLRMLLIRH